METNPATAITTDQVTSHERLSVAIARLVSNVDANTFETLLHNVAEWALTLYFECGRTDVDDDSEMLAVTLTDLIEDAKKLGRRGEALRTEVINAIVETYPMRVQTPSEWLQTSQQ